MSEPEWELLPPEKERGAGQKKWITPFNERSSNSIPPPEYQNNESNFSRKSNQKPSSGITPYKIILGVLIVFGTIKLYSFVRKILSDIFYGGEDGVHSWIDYSLILIILIIFLKVTLPLFKKSTVDKDDQDNEPDWIKNMNKKIAKSNDRRSGMWYSLTGFKLPTWGKFMATVVVIMFLLPAFGQAIAQIFAILYVIVIKVMEQM